MNKKFASLVLRAMYLREASYDHQASDKATAVADAERTAHPDNPYYGLVDYAQFYKTTMYDAAIAAAHAENEPELAEPVYLLLQTAWNDVEGWAHAQLGITGDSPDEIKAQYAALFAFADDKKATVTRLSQL